MRPVCEDYLINNKRYWQLGCTIVAISIQTLLILETSVIAFVSLLSNLLLYSATKREVVDLITSIIKFNTMVKEPVGNDFTYEYQGNILQGNVCMIRVNRNHIP